ncbi:MAG: PASTA domain-containing protein [Muribaculaceae bacterium]|nr:PASTA domain-containing protein [Muribaculaceae bacterium]
MTSPSGKFNLRNFYSRHPFVSHLIIVAIVGFILLWGVLIFLDYWTFHGETAVVPQVRNLSYTTATNLLEANHLNIQISDSIYDASKAPGTVIESSPKAGAVVKNGRTVYVTVTAFSPKNVTISMPLTGNVSSRQAVSYLRGIGITDIVLEHVPSEYVDLVEGARYGNIPLSVGSVLPVTATVTLTVGSGPSEFVPEDSIEADESYSSEYQDSEYTEL